MRFMSDLDHVAVAFAEIQNNPYDVEKLLKVINLLLKSRFCLWYCL